MANEPKRVSSHEKHGQGHERLVRRITARACIGLRSPHKRGAHDNGSTLQPVSGAVGASVLEDTMTVHRVALPSCALRREHALEETRGGGGVMRCMGLRIAGGLCVAWDSLTLRGFGGMYCMGLAHTPSLNCRERSVCGGGWLECSVV